MKLKNLTNDKLLEVINEYYENKQSIKELLKKHDIDYTSNFIQSAVLYSNDECELCGGKVKYILQSRSYCDSIEELEKLCVNCRHTTAEICNCEWCFENRRIKEEAIRLEKRKKIEKCIRKEPISVKELTCKELLFVGIAKEKNFGSYIGELWQKDYFQNLHTVQLDNFNFLEKLIIRGVIKVDLNETNLDLFKIDDRNQISYYPAKLLYSLNIKENLDEIDIKNELLNNYSHEELDEVWKQICLDECMRYLDIRTEVMGLGFIEREIRDSIKNLCEEMLLEYTMGRIVYLIYRAVNYASNFKIEYKVEEVKAHKAVYTNLKKFIVNDRYKTEFDRPYELIQTTFSEYICKSILQEEGGEVFKKKVTLKSFYMVDDNNIEENLIEDGIEAYNKLIEQVKELYMKKIPKDFIIKYLDITDSIYNDAMKKIDINLN